VVTAAPATVRTVLGDIAAADLGICDAHDHLFLSTPLLLGEDLDDPAAAEAELRAYRELGGQSVAQWTPFGLGRRVTDLAGVSRATGVHVIAATGLHQAAYYDRDLLDRVHDRLTELFIGELTEGLRSADDPDGPVESIRAGMIKVAGGFHTLDKHARRTLAAAAAAHHATGAPIGVHLELGTAATDVLDVLCERLEVPPGRVILGHLNRSPDPRVHARAAEAGAFLAFDGPSRAHHANDWRLLDALAALAAAGHADQLLLGGDTTTATARATAGTGPGMPYLLSGLRPAVERELGAAVAANIFVANPARAFSAPWR
jgi:phosphotriesterase-related protein